MLLVCVTGATGFTQPSPSFLSLRSYLGKGEERGGDDDGDEELENAAARGSGVVHGAVVVDGVVDGDVALEGDRHRQEDGAGQRDAVQRVQKLRGGFIRHDYWGPGCQFNGL